MEICKLPLALSKLEVPSTCLLFLGIELDALLLQLWLPHLKLMTLKGTLSTCIHKCHTKKELESLIGLLHDASIAIQPGYNFTS